MEQGKKHNTTEMKPIIIQFGKATSENDIDDLKILLEDISKRYNFRWFVDTYYEDKNGKSKMD